MTFHQDIGFQPAPPSGLAAMNPGQMVNMLQGVRDIQGQNALANAYRSAVDPTTGVVDQARMMNSLANSNAGWMTGVGGQQAGTAMEAQGRGTQAQLEAQRQQTTMLNGFLSSFDMSQPVSADQVDQKLQMAVRGGFATPSYYNQWQQMKRNMDPSELADVRPLIQAYKYVGQTAGEQADRLLGPDVPHTMQAQQWLGAFADPWTDQYGNVYQGTNADKLRFFGVDPNTFLRGGQTSSGAGGGQGGGRGAPTPIENPARAADIASLPDVQALPASIRNNAVNAMVNAGLGPQAASQYARMIWQESRGNQIDPQTGKIVTSNRGAMGVAQVMPSTFSDMKERYGIQGDINNIDANLNAGARYFREGLDQGQGDMRAAAAYYYGGPKGLQAYLHGQAGPDTLKYIGDTRAGGGGGGYPTGGLLRTPMTLPATQTDSANMFIAARQNYNQQVTRISNLQQSLDALRSHENLETGPLADDIQSINAVAKQLGMDFGSVRPGDAAALTEINKNLNRYYRSQPGATRSDMAELDAKLSNPSVAMQRQALDDLIARTIGMERAQSAPYLDFVARHPGRTSLAAGDYADETPGYANKIDPVGFSFDQMSKPERRAYYNSLQTQEERDRYEFSVQEAARLYGLRIPGS